MNKRSLFALPVALMVASCSTFTTPRYAANADTNVHLKSLGLSSIAVGSFSGPKEFDNACRAAGPLSPPDGLSHTEYLRKAFEDEFKFAGLHAAANARVVLSGVVNKLEFSSARGLTGGSWDIDVTLSSSNGKRMSAKERYEFESGFVADTACKQTAEAYMPTVQNLIKKIVHSPEFKGLVQ
jgi:hypothetical protein